MYKELQRTCTPIALLINKPFVCCVLVTVVFCVPKCKTHLPGMFSIIKMSLNYFLAFFLSLSSSLLDLIMYILIM